MDITSLLKAEIASQNEEVREWTGEIGGEEVTLCATPISPFDTRMVTKKFPGFETAPSSAAMVYLICHKATDKDGKKVFNKDKHAPIMQRLPLEFTSQIAQALFADDFDEGDLDLEKLEGNS